MRGGNDFVTPPDPDRKQREDEGIGPAAYPDGASNLQTGSEIRLKRLNLRPQNEAA
jgi:hypothetical protein